jgi:hypothetical protein
MASSDSKFICSVSMLLDYIADINAVNCSGWTSLMHALWGRADEAALVLLERGSDVHIKNERGYDALYLSIDLKSELMTFVMLCCDADTKNVKIDTDVTQARVDAAIAEYKNTQAFIDSYHELMEHTLSTQVKVDTRMCLRSSGLYQEPLERTLEYLGSA